MAVNKKNSSSRVEIDNEDQDFIVIDKRPRWYVIQTYVGFEDAVRKILDQKIENLSLSDKILEIFIPAKTVLKLNSKGVRQEKIEKIYPGYIYIHMVLDRETGYVLQNTNYISRIASTGDFAVALDDGYIEKLKEKLLQESDQNQASSKTDYYLNDLIQVIDGPFKDMRGKISAIDLDNSRVSVLLSIFDRETEVVLDLLEIKKAL